MRPPCLSGRPCLIIMSLLFMLSRRRCCDWFRQRRRGRLGAGLDAVIVATTAAHGPILHLRALRMSEAAISNASALVNVNGACAAFRASSFWSRRSRFDWFRQGRRGRLGERHHAVIIVTSGNHGTVLHLRGFWIGEARNGSVAVIVHGAWGNFRAGRLSAIDRC